MMRGFAKIDPVKLSEIQARNLDPRALNQAWIEMSDVAEAKITHLADTLPDTPIGIAFVDTASRPGWPGDTPGLTIHHPKIRGCLARVDGVAVAWPFFRECTSAFFLSTHSTREWWSQPMDFAQTTLLLKH